MYTLLTVKLIPRACGRWSKAIFQYASFLPTAIRRYAVFWQLPLLNTANSSQY